MNIKLIQLTNNDYIICEYEELDEEPSLYMKNPYRVTELTYWDYNDEDKHFPPYNAVFLKSTEEKNIKDGKETITIQSDYAQLERYPSFTNDVDILLNSDKIMTIIEPCPEILNLYTQLISK
jgi:PHP family Zn ribbon phosphoesterase